MAGILSQPLRVTEEDLVHRQTNNENTPLLPERNNEHNTTSTSSTRSRKWRELALFVWALLASAAVIILAVFYQHRQSEQIHQPPRQDEGDSPLFSGKRNLIFMVSDGMGPSSLSLTRSWLQSRDPTSPSSGTNLTLDTLQIGQSRTRSSSSLITDSAAGATAFSCGLKTYNGAISTLPDHMPCGSVMEAAKRAGYMTGLVVTTSVTDATPAVFVSHVRHREQQDEIARQMIGTTQLLGQGRMVDLVLGGGRCFFLPGGEERRGCRGDERDVLAEAAEGEEKWTVLETRSAFDEVAKTNASVLPLLGLFANGDIPYEIDRRFQEETYPSLEEMAHTALKLLSSATKDSEQGFFLMIEGSRIDHAGHANDPAAQVHEVAAYDRTVAAVLSFIEEENFRSPDTTTLMVATSDHETGGLAVGRQLHEAYPHYRWFPSVLDNATHSASFTSHAYRSHLLSSPSLRESEKEKYLVDIIESHLGISSPSRSELQSLIASPRKATYLFADMISRRAEIGWSSHGHTAADVNLYSSDGQKAAKLSGVVENTDVGAFLREFLGVGEEVEKVSRELRAAVERGLVLEVEEVEDGRGEGDRLDLGLEEGEAWRDSDS